MIGGIRARRSILVARQQYKAGSFKNPCKWCWHSLDQTAVVFSRHRRRPRHFEKALSAREANLGGVAALIKSGKITALAVSGENRHPDFPEVPTIRESGYPEYAAYNWTSFGVRTETPGDVTAKLADALQKVLATSEAREYVARSFLDLMPLPPAAMQKFQLEEIARWRRIAAAAGITPQ